jgi:hypothetical protein
MKFPKTLLGILFFLSFAALTAAQQPSEPRASLTEVATAADSKGAATIEGRLMTTVLNGAEDSPVTNVRIVIKNVSPTFYTYVSGWATFYDTNAVRCGEGIYKLDALAPNESAEVDTPGLRLRCSPTSWRITASNLVARTTETVKTVESVPAVTEAVTERPAPTNFIISINGEEHPIQINNPIVLKLGNRNSKIVLKTAP